MNELINEMNDQSYLSTEHLDLLHMPKAAQQRHQIRLFQHAGAGCGHYSMQSGNMYLVY